MTETLTVPETINPAGTALDNEKRITHWCDPYDLVMEKFKECPDCKTMGGFKHAKGCKHARHRLSVVRESCHGRVNFLEWCREEISWHAAKGTTVRIECVPEGMEPEAADWLCLVRE